MKRSFFVTVGTIAGLTATLRYTPNNPLLNSGTDLALGKPIPLDSGSSQTPDTQVTPKVPRVTASKASTPTPTATRVPKTTATPTSTKQTDKPKPTKPTKPTPPKPSPEVTRTPTTTPTPTITTDQTFTGTGFWARGYGVVQVKITVKDGQMTAITPLQFPTGGDSSRISGYSIPKLVQAALTNQTSSVATISGASFTSDAFRKSLASAMTNAGL